MHISCWCSPIEKCHYWTPFLSLWQFWTMLTIILFPKWSYPHLCIHCRKPTLQKSAMYLCSRHLVLRKRKGQALMHPARACQLHVVQQSTLRQLAHLPSSPAVGIPFTSVVHTRDFSQLFSFDVMTKWKWSAGCQHEHCRVCTDIEFVPAALGPDHVLPLHGLLLLCIF